MAKPLSIADLSHVLAHTEDLFRSLDGQRIFITGGTGFFGCWLLESFCHACDRLSLNAEALVLSRDPAFFLSKAPHLGKHRALKFLKGEAESFESPSGQFTHVIHAAINYQPPLELFTSSLQATRRTMEFAVESGARRYLFLSSGAVYGKQPSEITHVREDWTGAPDTVHLSSAYGEAKRASEFLCAAFHEKHGLEATIARCFAFVGPHMPLTGASAIGNFFADATRGGPIEIGGDGTPMRSYLYAADLTIWLWTILLRGTPARPYNVGSETACSIADLARIVADELRPGCDIRIAKEADPKQAPPRYIPSTERARSELGLEQWVDLREGVHRTAQWHSNN